MGKTVYFLGAGFSVLFGGPLQSNIIKEIMAIEQNGNEPEGFGQFADVKCRLLNFLEVAFPKINENDYEHINIEDIFSILDRAILNKDSFHIYSLEDLLEIRTALINSIIFMFKYKLYYHLDKQLLMDFLNILLSQNSNSTVSFITTNWEIILDNVLFKILMNKENPYSLSYGFDTDYYAYEGNSLKYFKNKDKIIHLLKLHGSMNWLYCPNCNRIFHDFVEKIASHELQHEQYNPRCRYCKDIYKRKYDRGDVENPFMLRSYLIMPTMLKELDNLYIQQIWHQASIELSQADELVFIGYSFPQADFEIRYLLGRSIRKDCKIKVVLYKDDEPKNHCTNDYHLLPEHRYKYFFGLNDDAFDYSGLEGYVKKNMEISNSSQQ
ncbi:hypothetical protein JXQ31_16985 [candidate division KSB1 bacterium]|nr:hypothetical protein [candidate division KSB1 bacterium]